MGWLWRFLASSMPPKALLKKLQSSDDLTNFDDSSVEVLVNLIRSRCKSLFSFSNKFLTFLIDPVIPIHVLDRGIYIVLNIRTFDIVALSVVENHTEYLGYGWCLQANFQPLVFAFGNSFGIQTLGVSGRYLIKGLSRVPNS